MPIAIAILTFAAISAMTHKAGFGTPEEARAMLDKVVAGMKSDKEKTLAPRPIEAPDRIAPPGLLCRVQNQSRDLGRGTHSRDGLRFAFFGHL